MSRSWLEDVQYPDVHDASPGTCNLWAPINLQVKGDFHAGFLTKEEAERHAAKIGHSDVQFTLAEMNTIAIPLYTVRPRPHD